MVLPETLCQWIPHGTLDQRRAALNRTKCNSEPGRRLCYHAPKLAFQYTDDWHCEAELNVVPSDLVLPPSLTRN